MKTKRENKLEYNRLAKLVDKAEKKAIEFVKKNLPYDSELRLQNSISRKLNLQ